MAEPAPSMLDTKPRTPGAGQVTIYHNPDCGTSRNVLALIRYFGIEPRIVAYLKTPPSRDELAAILDRAGLTPRQAVRRKGTPYDELGLADASDAILLDAMVAHPILINRPLVVTDTAVALCRPSDVALDLLPREAVPADVKVAVKEEGVPFLRDTVIAADDPGLIAALTAAHLPTEDLGTVSGTGTAGFQPQVRAFYAYCDLSGTTLGYGGYELYGEDVFLRSVVVLPEARRCRIGRNLVPLLLYRAWRRGAQTAWLLTVTAASFFEALQFRRRTRGEAPASILQMREAQSLCPASAVLLAKTIRF